MQKFPLLKNSLSNPFWVCVCVYGCGGPVAMPQLATFAGKDTSLVITIMKRAHRRKCPYQCLYVCVYMRCERLAGHSCAVIYTNIMENIKICNNDTYQTSWVERSWVELSIDKGPLCVVTLSNLNENVCAAEYGAALENCVLFDRF